MRREGVAIGGQQWDCTVGLGGEYDMVEASDGSRPVRPSIVYRCKFRMLRISLEGSNWGGQVDVGFGRGRNEPGDDVLDTIHDDVMVGSYGQPNVVWRKVRSGWIYRG